MHTPPTINASSSHVLERLIPLKEVIGITSLSKASIWRKVSDKSFPAPIAISKGRRAWRSSAVSRWIQEQEGAV
jgi:prophage regulatory protein